jgi:hypothetical protein
MSALCQKRTYALQQFFCYLITLSARPRSDGGTVIPRVRVLRFMTSVLFTLFSRTTLDGTQQQ